MIPAPMPGNEVKRMKALAEYAVLDTLPEQALDDLVKLASFICGTPIALVSLIDRDRQWFKARVGLPASETPRDMAFCAHAILKPDELMIVPDARSDARFADNPLVTADPSIRFYAGAPLVTPSGEALGTLCVIDRQPRELRPDQKEMLSALARAVMAQLNLSRSIGVLEQLSQRQDKYVEQLERYQEGMERLQQKLLQESSSDGLTGLPNRRAWQQRIDEEVPRAWRADLPLALMMIDVDLFKAYNDQFGHPAGDAVLKQVGTILGQTVRPYDYAARYGGEEFSVILPASSRDGALVMAERVRRNIQRAVWPLRPITVSIGVATLSASVTTVEQLLAAADGALYRSKAEGRNCVTLDELPAPGGA